MAVEQKRDPAVEIAALAPGTVFHGVFEVVRCIKAGGMGAVYEVLQTSTRRHRALKVMLPSLVTDPEMRARFELEAKIAAGVESEHIVETMDAGIDQATGMPFIVMELLKGEELGALLKARKRLSPEDVVTYLYQAAIALDRTHAAGIIHRDLKPENLFLTHRDDGSPRVKILDFGVAKIVADGSVNANSTKTVGSPMYMGPEQISGEQKIGPAVDRYSLAHIAFTLLVGKPYWHVERKAAEGLFPFMMQIIKGGQASASARAAQYGVQLPTAFDPWFVKAASVEPQARYETSIEMIAALAEVFAVPVPASAQLPAKRSRLPTSPTSSPAEPDKASSAQVLTSVEPGQTAPTVPLVEPRPEKQAPVVESVQVRSDELSLQPVSVSKPTRAWVVPVSLLLVGVVGVAVAFVGWPDRRSTPTPAPEDSARAPVVAARPVEPQEVVNVSSSPSAAPPIPSARGPETLATASQSTLVPAPPTSAPGVLQPANSATASPKPSATTKKSLTKGNDVLDQY